MPLVGLRNNSPLTRASAIAFLVFAAAFLAGCAGEVTSQGTGDQPPGFFPTPPVTDQGVATDNLYSITFWIAVVVFALVEGLLLYIVFRFRRRPADTGLPPQIHGSNPLEILWTIVPAITVTALFIGALITLNEETEARSPNPAVTVDVTGFQWQWTFDYPEQQLSFTGVGNTGPTMVLPVGETVRIRLHATDVIHSFYVPQFLYKKDAVPGRVNEFDVMLDKVGTYTGQCAEFCGLAHADMTFSVEGMTRADFDAWVAQQQQAVASTPPSPPPDAPTVELAAIGVTEGFNPSELTAPADSPWVVRLTNQDPAVPHDFAIELPDGTNWQGDPDAPGGGEAVYQPPPLPAGEYKFYCSLHPTTMIGALHVGQ